MDVDHPGDAVLHMCDLPLDTPFAVTDEGAKPFYEESGTGTRATSYP